MEQLKQFSDLASKILSNNTKYFNDKRLISKIFHLTEHKPDKALLRLTVIDSYYSTQMNKRFFGIEELSEALKDISNDDITLKKYALEYLADTLIENDVSRMFRNNFGYTKKGLPYGKAGSLVTKYLYFITSYKFPIFDRLVRQSYKEFQRRYKELNLQNVPDECNSKYFESIKDLKNKTGIESFDMLDKLLWLFGKVREGTYSLIIPKHSYLALVSNISIDGKASSKKVDNLIRNYLKNLHNRRKLNSLLSEQTMKFIDFCFNTDPT